MKNKDDGQKKNVSSVVDHALCSGCGACEGICSFSAIEMVRNSGGFLIPKIDVSKCIACGRCLRVCSGNPDNSAKIVNYNWAKGDYMNAYLAYSTDHNDRDTGQSGGAVTALLKYLLSNKIIDGAVVTGFDEKDQDSHSHFADDIEDLPRFSGSVYTQSEVVGCVIKNKDKKQAVVACGCHSQSLMLSGYRPDYVIGLVCERQYSIHFNKEFGKENKKEIRFRDSSGDNWPGEIKSVFLDGTIRRYPKEKRIALCDYYASYRCLQCFDMNNLYADLVCGDPWCMVREMDFSLLKKGYTVIVTRNDKGENLIRNAHKAGFISISKIDPDIFFDENCLGYNKVGRVLETQQVLSKECLPNLYADIDLERFLDAGYQSIYPKYSDPQQIMNRLNYSYEIFMASTKDRFLELVHKEKRKHLLSRLWYLTRIKSHKLAKVCKDFIIHKQ